MSSRISVKNICKELAARESVLVLCHASPDADTVCSALALCRALQSMGKHARMACADALPRHLLPFAEKQDYSPEHTEPIEGEYIVSVDIADFPLLGGYEALFNGKIDLMIDHHIKRTPIGKRYLIDPGAAACAEIIFSVIKGLCAYGAKIDTRTAELLYAGISADTGSFRYSNTTKKTLLAAARLYEYGIDAAKIAEQLHNAKPKSQVLAEMKIGAGMRFFAGDRIALVYADAARLSEINADNEDVSDIVSLPRLIEGVEIAVSLKEKLPADAEASKDEAAAPKEAGTAPAGRDAAKERPLSAESKPMRTYKISLRTGASVNAQKIASSFGGGGHIRAAGCTLCAQSTEDAIEKIVKACMAELKD